MKKKNTVLLLGILSILVVISIQVFLITGIWNQRNEMFALRYTLLSQEGLNFINRRMTNNGFDTVAYILGRYSDQANKDLHAIKDSSELAAKKLEVLDFFSGVLNKEEDLSKLLSTYFERRGFEKNFKARIIINDLEMFGNDTITVYRNSDFFNRRRPESSRRSERPPILRSSILVHYYILEDNNYRLSFDYFIDFSDKRC